MIYLDNSVFLWVPGQTMLAHSHSTFLAEVCTLHSRNSKLGTCTALLLNSPGFHLLLILWKETFW